MAGRDPASSTKTQLRARPTEPASPYMAGSGAASEADDPTARQPELLLGRYSVLETRATGGFGVVEMCWDVRLQRRVAIKRIPLARDGSQAMATSESDAIAEARVACMLAHPNIVTVYDFACDVAYAYIVMEYVNGLSLSELLARVEGGTLTEDEASYVLESLASALGFAHENGVLHMDIKPSNILIDRSGAVKLSDFGMAALASAAGYGGARGGTIGYMPPEQIVGDLIDERCDVFALATVVWQSLTGSCPFAARTASESLERIRRGPQPRLERTDPRLGSIVGPTLLKALEPDPTRRLASVEGLAEEVGPALGDADEGRASIVSLLGQLSEEDDPALARPHVPVAQAAPWLEGALCRAGSALVGGLAGLRTLGLLAAIAVPALSVPEARALAAAACAALGALVPRALGPVFALGLAASVALVGQTPETLAVRSALGLLVGFVGMAWWAASGRRGRYASASALAGIAFASPACAAPLAGAAASPGSAFVASLLGCMAAHVFLPLAQAGYSDVALASVAQSALLAPGVWVEAAGCGLAAAVASWAMRRGSTAMAIAGQFMGTVLVLCALAAGEWMENGSILMASVWPAAGVALLLYALMTLAIAVFGVPDPDAEV
ncbi:MAG: serine/threonine protein kinase [Atopobiaceae bacterium]|nr:serine/threonine protein kinase [Atopobiaceae bacterium]MCH4119866.1 serine/threonine protein kinase [Atopobiaceae bacterium]MCI1317724.1 serine/threonine protein kinase [Atopobiaceae bacterium]MCI1389147.1 serine/threonine protein kinase [Atopobiaceae bacterium]MCI1432842.1 serine/threonine protein kinase [Atopobiaceae bacterium]